MKYWRNWWHTFALDYKFKMLCVKVLQVFGMLCFCASIYNMRIELKAVCQYGSKWDYQDVLEMTKKLRCIKEENNFNFYNIIWMEAGAWGQWKWPTMALLKVTKSQWASSEGSFSRLLPTDVPKTKGRRDYQMPSKVIISRAPWHYYNVKITNRR